MLPPLGHRHQTVLCVGHWLDIGVWHRVELVEVQLVVRADVNVGALVLCAITVSWGGED